MLALENSAKIVRQAEEFEAQYELATKDQEIEGLQNRETISIHLAEQRRLALVIISVLLIISLMIAFRLRRQHINIKKLNQSINEKSNQNEVLLKEIHHRVKNNLQMVSSLMAMQKRQISDVEMLTLFQQTQSRVQTISLIHDHLYRYNQYATVKVGHFIKDLITMLTNSYEHLAIPKINYQLDDYELDIDLATSLGLIINELVTNSFKYAFVDHKQPELVIKCSVGNDTLTLKVGDNGHPNQPFQKGFGWKIIDACVEGNSGTSKIEIDEGYDVTVTFHLNNINK
jgi:two-component sensor histidine kinase